MKNNSNKYNLVAQNPQSTVVTEYTYTPVKKRSAHYQSEAELERAFIEQLGAQAYESHLKPIWYTTYANSWKN